ncbi:MAG: hypothetical protein RLZ12_865 [Bacillota bacterium]
MQKLHPFWRIILITSSLIGATLLVLRIAPLPEPTLQTASIIYDDKDQVIAKTDRRMERIPVKLNKIPKHVLDATLTSEDRSFYKHWGFSIRGIIRALYENIKARRIVQGASTVTQQLARNLYLSHNRSWFRKIHEALLTIQLELKLQKPEILEKYFNNINYGNGAIGLGTAAKLYFNKEVKDLSIAEGVMLSCIPRNPSLYSPYAFNNRSVISARHAFVLNKMAEAGKITAQQALQAKRSYLTIKKPPAKQVLHANYARDYIIKYASEKFNLDPRLLYGGGLKIYTTLNNNLQTAADYAVSSTLENKGELQGALVAIDPQTGCLKAMIGGKKYEDSQLNRADSPRQPGSAFKPAVYLSALENGETALTKIKSTRTCFGNYCPRNYGNIYQEREITMHEAIPLSDNIFAVSMHLRHSPEKTIAAAKKLGIHSPLKAVPSLALGSSEVKPVELAEMYATLASQGIRRPLFVIRKITDSTGKILAEDKETEQQVATPEHTFVLTQLLTNTFESSTGTARDIKQPTIMAGKTGTSNSKDGWMAGFSPQLVATSWIGYDKGKDISTQEEKLAKSIWDKFMRASYRTINHGEFKMPNKVRSVQICRETGKLASSFCPHQDKEYFVSGTEPTKNCTNHKFNTTPEPGFWEDVKDKFRKKWYDISDWFR